MFGVDKKRTCTVEDLLQYAQEQTIGAAKSTYLAVSANSNSASKFVCNHPWEIATFMLFLSVNVMMYSLKPKEAIMITQAFC